MKNSTFILLFLIVCLAASCKKSDEITNTKNSSTLSQLVADTSAFSIDGKLYTYNQENTYSAGNREPNKKLDSVDSKGYSYFSGDKDSVLYNKSFTLYGNSGSITFYFIKKYAKKQLIQNAPLGLGIFSPADNTPLYIPGDYTYALDFNRENTQNGIAIEVTNNKFSTSYNPTFLGYKTTITPASQNGSQFKIINFQKLKAGGYLLEAKFQVNLFDVNENVKKLENGYVKIHVF